MKACYLKTLTGALFASAVSFPAVADGDFILDMRLRSEMVAQDGFANDAEALTLRTRFGYHSGSHEGWSFLIEGESVLNITDDFNSTTNGNTAFPVVADPEAGELNRAQIKYTGLEGSTFTLGRQRIILGDARYVGNVGWRQNEQTFDAFLFQNTSVENVTFTYAYMDRVHRILGDDHPAGEWDLDAHTAMAALETGRGKLTGFAFLTDVRDAAGASNATYGINWSGQLASGNGPTIRYMLEYAVQSDYGNSPANFDLSMFRGSVSASQNGLTGTLGIELLEGDGTRGFVTPLATLHKFQGRADVFLGTPANGIRDVHVRAAYAFPEPFFGQGMNASIAYHDFESDRGSLDLGSEIDIAWTARLTDAISVQMVGAFYNGPTGGPADRDKLWFLVSFSH